MLKGQKYTKEGTITQTDADGNIIHTEEGIVIGRGDSKRVIVEKKVAELAALHCSWKEMAEYFGCKENTLRDHFRETVQKAKAETKQRLRAAQLEHAINGNATLLIWLGKNMLGQSDQQHEESTVTVLPWSDDIEKAQVEEAYNNLEEGDEDGTE